jgi:phosphoribosyl 1,2-cyclic phosphate phosphodiesterase
LIATMRLTFLGTGTSSGVPMIGCSCAVCTSTDPRDQRLRSSVLIEDQGTTVLIDAGPDLRQQLLRANVRALDAVLLTHEHIDHIAGIDELRAFNFFQKKPMPVYGMQRTLDAVRHMYAYAFERERYPGTPQLDLRPIGNAPFAIGLLRFTPVEVMHFRMTVFGYRLGDLAYVTDAKTISQTEKEKLRGCTTLVLNALRDQEHLSHLTLAEALAWVEELEPEHALFTHVSHQMGRHSDLEDRLPAKVRCAFDGLVIDA